MRSAIGVAGADRVIITREVIRDMARVAGAVATFSPKPTADGVGNGCHLHMSFRDAHGGNATVDESRPGHLSRVAEQFVSGIQKHMNALLAFTAPSPVSYLRLGPHHWSCGYNAVGVQNREAAIRICTSPGRAPAERSASYNLEFRATDATASPYLTIGVLVRAGLEGIRANLPAPRLIEQDPDAFSPAEREKLGITALPDGLEIALDAFRNDTVVSSWFTPTMREAYLALKETEKDMAIRQDPSTICERYICAY